jgi:hypothetical protein
MSAITKQAIPQPRCRAMHSQMPAGDRDGHNGDSASPRLLLAGHVAPP